MFQRLFVVTTLAVMVTSGSADLSACGDKFLRVGRSARFRGYAAVHPASILIYSPGNATPAGIQALEALLKRAGHKVLAVQHGTSLPQTLAGAPYDLVIADYADAVKIKDQLASVPSRPDVLPILYKPTKTDAAEAERAYPFVLKPQAMSKAEALAEIDHLMMSRLHGATAVATK